MIPQLSTNSLDVFELHKQYHGLSFCPGAKPCHPCITRCPAWMHCMSCCFGRRCLYLGHEIIGWSSIGQTRSFGVYHFCITFLLPKIVLKEICKVCKASLLEDVLAVFVCLVSMLTLGCWGYVSARLDVRMSDSSFPSRNSSRRC